MSISSGTLTNSAEALDRLVSAGGLQFEFGAGVAEGGCPGIELVDAALAQRVLGLEAQQGVHLARACW